MSTPIPPPDLEALRAASKAAFEAYRGNKDGEQTPRLEEALDRARLAYGREYCKWEGADPLEKYKWEPLIKGIEDRRGWGETRSEKEAEVKG